MKNILVATALLFSTSSMAEWKVVEHVDAMTDQVTKIAYVDSDDGKYSYSIHRRSGGGVWASFSINSELSVDVIDHRRSTLVRYGKYGADNLDKIKDLSSFNLVFYESGARHFNYHIWHGKEDQGVGRNIKNILSSDSMLVRYYVVGDTYRDVRFTLGGVGEALSDAIGIAPVVDEKKEAMKEAIKSEISKLFMDRFMECVKMHKGYKHRREECGDIALACSKAADTVREFKQCIQ